MNTDVLRAPLHVVRPLGDLTPSEFAARYRYLKEGTTFAPGLWSNSTFPHLVPVMDAVKEAIESGKNLAFMKSGQSGGSEGMQNGLHWLQCYYPGPMLYLISKDEIAREFGRDRFSYALETIEPLKVKHLAGKANGETIQIKRLVDGKLVIAGGQSILNLISSPYRIVMIDEYDSMLDDIKNAGDPLKNAQVRTDAFAEGGSTLVVAFAHPTTKDRGTGKLYYQHSDQRRCHIPCPSCHRMFPLVWDHVRAKDERDPHTYKLHTPCCDHQMSDGERFSAIRYSQQLSTLAPEEAAKKRWIGVHVSQLCFKPLLFLAQEWVSSADEPSVRRVVVNKRMGDVYDDAEFEVGMEAWARLKSETPVGTVPDWVEFLTSGQDSGVRELHWAVWGWGRVDGQLRGRLIEAGAEPGPAAYDDRRVLDVRDLEAFDEVLYGRPFGIRKVQVAVGLHDSGWMPGAVYEYCRRKPGRSFPSKGLAVDDRSRAPAFAWHQVLGAKAGQVEIRDPNFKRADLNTYALKVDFFALAEAKRLELPSDVLKEFCHHLSSEKLVNVEGRRKWIARGPNHWLDCSILAFAAALNVDQVLSRRSKAVEDDSSPAWRTGARGGRW